MRALPLGGRAMQRCRTTYTESPFLSLMREFSLKFAILFAYIEKKVYLCEKINNMKDFSDDKRKQIIINVDLNFEQHKEDIMNANALNVDLDTPIYRIYDYIRFLEMLKSQENVLVRPSFWEDPFENMLYNIKYYKMSNGNKVSLDVSDQRDAWYGQCWTDKEDECDGLWRVYSNNRTKRCVRVKSTVRKMFEPLFDTKSKFCTLQFFIGKVEYDEETQIKDLLESVGFTLATDTANLCQAKSLLTKRKEFRYESEVRILYNEIAPNMHKTIHTYKINPNEAFDEVIIDPWCEDRFVPNYLNEIFNAGYHQMVRKSNLYNPLAIEFLIP